MDTKNFVRYLNGEAEDSFEDGPKNETLAEHRKHCEAEPGNCPFEKKLQKDDDADAIEGVSSQYADMKGDSPYCIEDMLEDDLLDLQYLDRDIGKRVESAKLETIEFDFENLEGGPFTFTVPCVSTYDGIRRNEQTDEWEDVFKIAPLDAKDKLDADVSSINASLEGTGLVARIDDIYDHKTEVYYDRKSGNGEPVARKRGEIAIRVGNPDAYVKYAKGFSGSNRRNLKDVA